MRVLVRVVERASITSVWVDALKVCQLTLSQDAIVRARVQNLVVNGICLELQAQGHLVEVRYERP